MGVFNRTKKLVGIVLFVVFGLILLEITQGVFSKYASITIKDVRMNYIFVGVPPINQSGTTVTVTEVLRGHVGTTKSVIKEHVRTTENVIKEHVGTTESATPVNKTACPENPPGLVGGMNLTSNMTPTDLPLRAENIHNLQPGGRFTPRDCEPRHRTAIVIPYRYREAQLQTLLNHLHTVLQRQKIGYTIFVVEEAPEFRFNRGLGSNVGFEVASKTENFTCYIFHDVDHLLMNDRCIYTCSKFPRLFSTAASKNSYKLPYSSFFGGVQAFTKEQFVKANGFTNLIFGWGGEDDDIELRIKKVGLRKEIVPSYLGRYMTLDHDRDPRYQDNPYKGRVFALTRGKSGADGLNTLKYQLVKKELRPLYTWLYITVNQTDILKDYQKELGDHVNLPTSR